MPLFVGALLALACTSGKHQVELSIVLCQPPVRPVLQLGRATLVIPFALAFDSAGSVARVEALEPQSVDESEMRQCLQRWKAGGIFRGQEVRAEFLWEHGSGWKRIRVLGGGLDLKVALDSSPQE